MARKSGHFRTDLHKLPIPKHLDTAKIFLFHRKEPGYNDIPRFLPVHTSQKKSESKIKIQYTGQIKSSQEPEVFFCSLLST